MAKEREVPGIDGEVPYAMAAARVVRVRAAEVGEKSGGVLNVAEIERVHAMRVATRRLRAALEAFKPCFPKGEFKAALREVKAIADALGERRDRDVAIAALERFASGAAEPERPGIESLIAGFRAEQLEANEDLRKFVDEPRLRALADRLASLVAAAERRGAKG